MLAIIRDGNIKVEKPQKNMAIIQDGCVFVTDERWITINADKEAGQKGQHVLIKENGDIIAGLGGNFKNLKDLSRKSTTTIKGVTSIKEDKYCFTGTGNLREAIIYTLNDGKKIIYPKNYNPADQTMPIEKIVELWEKVPENIRKLSQNTIEIVDYDNPRDSFWRKKYKNFNRSYMTGGESSITVYKYTKPHDEDYFVEALCHEIGHKIDIVSGRERGGRGARISERALWKNAIKKDGDYPSSYARVHTHEDFAESVKAYATNKALFHKYFPNRAKTLDKILNKGGKK